MITPQGTTKSFKDLRLSVGSADCFIVIRIHTDHGSNYIANQLLLSSLKQWFGRKGLDVNESKMWAFCFITQQTSGFLQLSPCGSFMHLFWCQRWCFSNNWNFWEKDIGNQKLISHAYSIQVISSYNSALLKQTSVHQDRWRLLFRDQNRSIL